MIIQGFQFFWQQADIAKIPQEIKRTHAKYSKNLLILRLYLYIVAFWCFKLKDYFFVNDETNLSETIVLEEIKVPQKYQTP